MQDMRESRHFEALRAIRPEMCGVLRQAGDFGAPQQSTSGGNAGGHRQVQGSAWPGSDLGVRAPMPGETPISWAEVHHGMKEGLL